MQTEPLVIKLEQPEWDVNSREVLANLLEPALDHRNVIVDMTDVVYIDSTCLGKLFGMRRQRGERNFPCERFVVSTYHLRRLLSIVGFDKVWNLYDTLEAALADSSESETAKS